MKQQNPLFIKLFRWFIVIIVISVAIAGLITSGAPGNERAKRLDDERVNLLDNLSRGIDQYWGINQTLPKTLEQLLEERTIVVNSIQDPETEQIFEYSRTGDESYNLCAIFSAKSREKNTPSRYGSVFWEHKKGRACFSFQVESNLKSAPMIIR